MVCCDASSSSLISSLLPEMFIVLMLGSIGLSLATSMFALCLEAWMHGLPPAIKLRVGLAAQPGASIN